MAFNNEHNIPHNGFGSNGSSGGEYFGGPETRPAHASDPDEIDLKQLFFTLWHYKWIIAGCVVAFSILAGIVAWAVTPVYRSEGSILITDSQGSPSLGDSGLGSLLSTTYGIGMGSTVANELQILRSRRLSLAISDTLMEKRLMENGNQFPVLWREYREDSMMTSRDTVAMRLREHITFTQVDREADLVQITYESPSPLEAAAVVNLSMQLYSDISTRQNRMSASSAVAFLEKERKRIEEQLVKAEERLQAFMNEYHLVQVDAQTEELIKQMALLESKRQEARVKLVAINAAIGQYNDRMDSIKPGLADQYAEAIGPNMARLQYQLAELQIKKMQLLANNPGIKNNPDPPQEVVELDRKIGLYENQIRDLAGDLISQSDQYLGFLGGAGESIAQSITELNQKLIELQVEQQQYRAQVDVLTEQLNEQEQFFENLPDNIITLARLKRDVMINEELFLTISTQYAEMALWEQTQFGLGRPVDIGYVPQEPVEPRKILYVLVGFILGGILSIGYVLVREAFKTTLDGVEELKKLPYPLLSVIPMLDDARFRTDVHKNDTITVKGEQVSANLVSLVDSISPASEAFRRLQNHIMYARPDQKIKTIMVTSSTKGEGKSTTCANLAVSLSELGKKVLIIDLDLRRPNMHNLFGLRQSPGIFDILFEGEPNKEAIQSTVAHSVDLLSAGKRPPNPAAVLQSEALSKVIGYIKQSYDFVLIDTAPFGIITDAAPLTRMADGVVVVTRFNKTTGAQLKHTLGELTSINAQILGTVFTAFDYKKSSDSYSNQYYKNTYHDYRKYQIKE